MLAEVMQFGSEISPRDSRTKALYLSERVVWHHTDRHPPFLTDRKHPVKHYLQELMWDLNGNTNVNTLGKASYLWQAWADRSGYLPNSYGASFRNFAGSVDQLRNTYELLKRDIHTRRAVIHLFDPTNQPGPSDLGVPRVPPCHPTIIFHTVDERYLSLTVLGRSQDLIVGFPGDVIRYFALLQIFCRLLNVKAKELIWTVTNGHVYEPHREYANEVILRRSTPSFEYEGEFVIPQIKTFDEMLALKPRDFNVGTYYDLQLPKVRFKPIL